MASTELCVGDQTIRYDRDGTQQAYRGIAKGSADRCGCQECQHFVAQRHSAFPESFRELLEKLGIDSKKEEHLYDWGRAEDGTITYGGWFYLTGEIVKAGDSMQDGDGVQYFFRRGSSGNGPSLLLEFVLKLNSPLPDTPST